MQSARVVFLNDKSGGAADLLWQRLPPLRLGGLREVALRFVFPQAHRFNLTADYADETDFAQDDRTLLRSGGNRLANEVTGEAADHNVLAKFRNSLPPEHRPCPANECKKQRCLPWSHATPSYSHSRSLWFAKSSLLSQDHPLPRPGRVCSPSCPRLFFRGAV